MSKYCMPAVDGDLATCTTALIRPFGVGVSPEANN